MIAIRDREVEFVTPRIWTNETGLYATPERILTYGTVLQFDRHSIRGPRIVGGETNGQSLICVPERWWVMDEKLHGVKLVTDEFEIIAERATNIRLRPHKWCELNFRLVLTSDEMMVQFGRWHVQDQRTTGSPDASS